MGLALEAMPVHALLLQCPDHPFNHPVLLWAVRGDELLLRAIATRQARVDRAGEYHAVVRAQQEGLLDSPGRAVAGDQGLLQSGRGCAGLAGP